MKQFVWIRSLRKLGEEIIDLYSCRRFKVWDLDPFEDCDGESYFLTQDGRWICYRKTLDRYSENGDRDVEKTFRECHPEEVAFALLWNNIYGLDLPEELASYRRYGDIHVLSEWRWANEGRSGVQHRQESKSPIPRWDGTVVMFDNQLCKRFARKAPRQEALLDEFEAKKWSATVKNPFACESILKDTLKEMNKWKNSPLYFHQIGRGVGWRVREQKTDLP